MKYALFILLKLFISDYYYYYYTLLQFPVCSLSYIRTCIPQAGIYKVGLPTSLFVIPLLM